MLDINVSAKHRLNQSIAESTDYQRQILSDSQDWRELEKLSLELKQQGSSELSNLFYQQAEELFLQAYPEIETDDLLFREIDWTKYVNFFSNLKQANYTKLKSIKRLYTKDIANGRLGKYLIAQKRPDVAVKFFTNKIVKHPEQMLFYHGYQKLIENLIQIISSSNATPMLEQLHLNLLSIELQLQLIKNYLHFQTKLRQAKIKLDRDDINAPATYTAMLQNADKLLQENIKKSKLLPPLSQYPKVATISKDGVAIAGKKNWFYIHEGSNYLIDYHTGSKQLSASEIKQWKNLLEERLEWHQAHNIAYQHLFVPNKIAIYPECYPQKLNCVRDRPIVQLRKQCQQNFLYPNGLFSKQKNNYRLYNKQDCHWNFWGCYFAYRLVCRSLGISPNENLLNLPIKISSLKGDLGDKFGIREKILDVDFEFNSKISFDNKLINYCHQGSIRVLKNSKVAQGKMIIFGDSFSNPGFPNYKGKKRNAARLASLFAETLNEVHFVWTPWIDYDYIEREKPDFVLTEMAERFLIRVPDDRNHLPLEEFAAMRLNKYKSKAS